MKLLRVLLILTCAFAWSSYGDVVCSGTASSCAPAAGVTSPVTTDPLSFTGVVTFNNAANTPITASDGVIDSTLTSGRVCLVGTSGRLVDDADLTFDTATTTGTNVIGSTSLAAVGAADVANSIVLTANTLTSEGSSADANELLFTFGNHTGDGTAAWLGTAGGATLKLGAGASSAPALVFGTDTSTGLGQFTTNTISVWTNGGTEIAFGVGATDYLARTGNVLWRFESGSLRAASGQVLSWSNSATAASGTIDTTIARGAAGAPTITQQALTVATMTAENTGQLRSTTHSYTWTNAQVVALGAATTGDISVATLPAKTQVLDAAVVITGAAVGPATVTVSCGDAIGGTPFINYIVASDAKAAANTVYGDAVAERGTSIDVEFYNLPSYTATTLVTCHFISTGANLDTITGSTGRVILTTRLLP